MDIKLKVKELIDKINKIKTDDHAKKGNALPSDCYFLNDDEIVCFKRRFGDSRYPYSCDGLTLWAFSSGNIRIEESTFNVTLDFTEGKEPNLAFFAGKKIDDGFFPVSITGAGKLPFENSVERFTVYTPDAAYYITDTDEFIVCVRMFIDGDKKIRFTSFIENKINKPLETYLSAYFNCMLSHANYEYIETKWYRSSQATDNGFKISVTEYINRTNCFTYKADIVRDYSGIAYSTTSHTDYCGGMHNQLCCSTALQKGRFEENKGYTEFTDTAIAGEIIPLTLEPKESFVVSYTLSLNGTKMNYYKTADIDEKLYSEQDKGAFGQNIPDIQFQGNWKDLKGEKFRAFVKNVFRQVEFCARAKNYAGPFIGIRDIFQQLEAALMWIPDYCRNKIVEALNFIGDNGRPPRQYSYPASDKVLPAMDMRPFIDQGVWIISTVYTYLCYTGDFSILNEQCGYYKYPFHAVGIDFSNERDSVLEHLLRICEFLISNLDKETNCLHAVYGDWNDSLDGLGKTEDTGKEYGTGVSVMATLQFYKNLGEISEILTRCGKKVQAERYLLIRDNVRYGLQKHAIVNNDKGERKILHGWFDKMEDFVGSFCDNDGENRDGLTSSAFWVIAGAINWDLSLKKDILAIYKRLDSKYGLKTFEPAFSIDNKKVGHINCLPEGTAENGATYIHATLFGIWSLFEMGEDKAAWEQLYKILPLTHKFISTTPFVMPNSYVENAEKGFDGESMSDWFTGSGCVLLKVIIWYVFGVKADLDGLSITPAAYIPFENLKITLHIKDAELTICYSKTGNERAINGKKGNSVRFKNADLKGKKLIVSIID